MGEAQDRFEERYRQLAVVTCEWRALGLADPSELAEQVFQRLRTRRQPPDLKAFYRAVEDVIGLAYREQSGKRSLLEGLLTGSTALFNRPNSEEDQARAALASLPSRDLDALRQRFWDELTPEEMAEVNGRDAAAQRDRLTSALARLGAKLPAGLAQDPAAAMRALHPGSRRRHAEGPSV